MSTPHDQREIPSTATDLELLRAFEPVVRFTSGEQFFPMDVERYVHASGLWTYHPDDHDEEVIPESSPSRASSSRAAPLSNPCSTFASSLR